MYTHVCNTISRNCSNVRFSAFTVIMDSFKLLYTRSVELVYVCKTFKLFFSKGVKV